MTTTREGTGRLLEPRSIFKATAVNHISYGVSDYAKTRDFYMDLLGMKCVFDDGNQCAIVFGNPERAFYLRKTKSPEGKVFVDHLAYSIANFDLRAVEAELKRYGFNPQPDGDFAWTITDPDGFRIQICAETGVLPGAPKPGTVPAAHIPTGNKAQRPGVFKTTAVNHIAYQVSDYAKSRDFYMDLLGMRLAFDDGIKASVAFGEIEDALYLTPNRNGGVVNHLAVSVADFDLAKSEEALKKFGLHPEPDGDSAWTMVDPDGFRMQVCDEVGVYPGAARDFFHQLKK